MNSNATSKRVFLATTACEEFWDTAKPIVFLGEWCLRHDKRSLWGALDGHVMESPYGGVDAEYVAYRHVNEIYEQVLPILADRLNSIHETDYSLRYWRIVIGPWLRPYVSVLFDRYEHVKKALEKYPDITTIVLSNDSLTVPVDTRDFLCGISDDLFNLKIFSKLFSYFGKRFPSKHASLETKNEKYRGLIRKSWKQKILGIIEAIHKFMIPKMLPISVLFKDSYFPRWAEICLLFTFRGLALSSIGLASNPPEHCYSHGMREGLKNVSFGDSDFFRCLSYMIFSDIPLCFVEGFKSNREKGRQQYPGRIKAIFSANAWNNDEVFKCWAAKSADEGALLLGTQHGGNYGVLNNMPSEDHETAIVDYYYSWGWERTDCQAKVVPMPATKLVGRKEIGPDNSKKGVLWAATIAPRYVTQFPYLPMHFQGYLTWQARFANALPQEVMAEIRFRPHREDHAWGVVERMKDCVRGIRIESWDVPFQASLENCRLYVCDHLSTTFAEALAANKPTVLFWDPQSNRLKPEAQPYFDLLNEAGILFDSPEDAASAVEAVYDDVEAWWNAPERQKAVRSFCERFARTSPDAIALWSNELKRLSDSHSVRVPA